jgi:hypothetical protein
MRFICLLVAMSVATPAIAQERSLDAPAPKLIISDRAIAEGMDPFDSRTGRGATASVAQGQQRDSVKDGMIIGGIAGAMVMGTGVGLLCKALQESGDPTCWKAVGVGGLYGAGIGLVLGAGVDALFKRSPRTLSPEPPAARVAPVRP